MSIADLDMRDYMASRGIRTPTERSEGKHDRAPAAGAARCQQSEDVAAGSGAEPAKPGHPVTQTK